MRVRERDNDSIVQETVEVLGDHVVDPVAERFDPAMEIVDDHP